MHLALKTCNAVHWLALALWMSALVAAAIAAMAVFGTVGGLNLTMHEFASLPAPAQARIAGGMIMEKVFFTVDLLQFIAVPAAVLTLLVQLALLGTSWRTPWNLLRTVCLLLAAGLFIIHATALAPPMNRDLRAYWNAARQGDLSSADAHLESFQSRHRIADGIFRGNLLLLLIVIPVTAIAQGPPRSRDPHMHIPTLLRLR